VCGLWVKLSLDKCEEFRYASDITTLVDCLDVVHDPILFFASKVEA
jgi:hypothetical protein